MRRFDAAIEVQPLAAAEGDEARALAELAAATASGVTPPAGPAFKRGALPPLGNGRDFDRLDAARLPVLRHADATARGGRTALAAHATSERS